MAEATTLFIVMGLASLLMLGVLGSLMRSGIPGVKACIQAACATALGIALTTAQPVLPPILGVFVANMAMGLGMVLYLVAVRQFFGQRLPVAVMAVVLGVEFAGLVLVWYAWRETSTHLVFVSAIYALLAAAIGITVLRNRPYHRPAYPYTLTVGVAMFVAVGYAVRGMVYLLRNDSAAAPVQYSPMQIVFLGVGLMALPGLTLAMIMMIHDRMLEERESEPDTDHLTGLLSTNAWWLLAEKIVARALSTDKQLSLLMLDIDRLQKINDAYGHQLGDAVLQHFGTLADDVLPGEEIVGRIGGEEFAVLFPDTRIDAALFASEKLRQVLRGSACSQGGWSINYTFSGGLVQWNGEESAQALAQRAGEALNAAKDGGRDRIVAHR
ncbi:diguanylate cyclase [Bordetella sp. N]|uniref:GGDEF domain-containing protein n=1 Tax=Bordetella sp. N TaxID=1746199 RepID=UPI00070F8814|nr:GGDEF domain-containing protein [Bordetella sp. N]ALM83132.1 hypothetical protein ASB57_09340 [Bordetella sp. N]